MRIEAASLVLISLEETIYHTLQPVCFARLGVYWIWVRVPSRVANLCPRASFILQPIKGN